MFLQMETGGREEWKVMMSWWVSLMRARALPKCRAFFLSTRSAPWLKWWRTDDSGDGGDLAITGKIFPFFYMHIRMDE